MLTRILPAGVLAASLCLASCASPYFVHDPQTLMVNREEVPRLLKSLRCELATYIAANNQRNMMFVAEAKVDGIQSASEKYQYFEIDPKLFGVVNLMLQIQDIGGLGSAIGGLSSGTNYEWLQSSGARTLSVGLAPTLLDQSTYTATLNFIVPQDAIALYPGSPENQFACYSEIPKRVPPPFNSVYTEEDLDALARDEFPQYALFKRVLVNNTTPLAAWLEDVGGSVSKATLGWQNPQEKSSEMIPGQMSFSFAVQVIGGLNVTYTLTSPVWPVAATQLGGAVQKTNTIQIFLNGIEASSWFTGAEGLAKNTAAKPLPTIKVSGARYPLPTYVGRTQSRGHPQWPYIVLPPR